ncbi:MAG TPA: hypothetical protein VFZ34_17760 [Blastocatellia bacterium]|nr:hypothetical protein [Blastocatellia bacterium]
MLPQVEDKLLARYLLGTLSEEERAQVEEQLFANTDCYDRLLALKEELTDQCVLGDLTRREQQTFARRFLTTPEGREDALFARALDAVVREEKAAQQPIAQPTATTLSWREKLVQYFQFPVWQMAMTAAAVLLAIGAGVLWMQTRQLQQQLAKASQQIEGAQTKVEQAARNEAELAEQLRRAQTRNEELDQLSRTAQQERDQARKELERLSSRPTTSSAVGTLLSLILAPGAGRGDGKVDELSLTPQTQNVQLRLLLSSGEAYSAYRAEIRTKQGDLIQTLNRLPLRQIKDGKAAQLTVPARLLQEGMYEVRLIGVRRDQTTNFINYYDFKITRGR